MRISKLLSILLLLSICFGCTKYSPDFWNQTIVAIRRSNATLNKEKWDINVQDKDLARDPNHRELSVRYINQKYPHEEVSFAFHNRGSEYILYQYEKKVKEQINLYYTSVYHHKVEIKSTDSEFRKYTVSYTMDEYRNDKHFDSKSMKGNIEILSDGKINYDLVPYLASAIDSLNIMLDEFEVDYVIDYDMVGFVHLPKLMDDLYIPSKTEITEETSNTLNFYSKDRINAKGYRLVTFVKILKDYSTLQMGEYSIEQGAYSYQYDAQLKLRTIENSYDLLLPGDPDEQYAIYIKDDVAYLYLQSSSDDFIIDDVENYDAKNAKRILYEGERNF